MSTDDEVCEHVRARLRKVPTMTRREEIARALRTYQQADPEAVIVEVSRQVCDEAAAILALPAQEPSELVKQLLNGVPNVGVHEDNSTELFDIEEANDTMAEAASALTDQAAEIERLEALCTLQSDTISILAQRLTDAVAERDDYKRKLDDAVAALELAAVEIGEAADKMHVLGLNHPGGKHGLDEDRAFMVVLAKRFSFEHLSARSVLAALTEGK